MRIDLRDEHRRRIGRVEVDPVQRPTRAAVQPTAGPSSASENASPREVFLNWDTALDDAGQVRRCVVCGCPDLFHEKAFPQVTAFVVVLAFVGAVLGVLGLAENTSVLIAMLVVLVLDVAILFFSRRRLVCYQCRSTYRNLRIARYHRRWDRARADRYPPKPATPDQEPASRTLPTSTASA